ncbi:MAG: flagellar hook basal-body protein [Myxococcales bacterium FL481]|nr:MAG: flagellar hook basal-body protein [Myxococcales bacterium FL481]
MANGVYIAMSAAVAAERQLSVTANNLANVNTTGYKQTRTAFDAYLVKTLDGAPEEKGFTAMSLTQSDLRAGALETTGNPLDAALAGPGFFVVQTPDGEQLTRAGSFRLNEQGTLVTALGHPVLTGSGAGRRAPIQIDPGGGPVTLGSRGEVAQAGTVLASLAIVNVDPSSLTKVGDTAFRAPAEAYIDVGDPIMSSGYLERSNVNPIRGMIELIGATREYERSAKIMSKYRSLDRRTLEIV